MGHFSSFFCISGVLATLYDFEHHCAESLAYIGVFAFYWPIYCASRMKHFLFFHILHKKWGY
jgi:hypothetical protein